MEGMTTIYQGRIVSKEKFRAFIYSYEGKKKLVNSWEEFENHMQTGIWFASIEELNEIKPVIEEKKKKKSKIKKEYEQLDRLDVICGSPINPEFEINDGLAFEV